MSRTSCRGIVVLLLALVGPNVPVWADTAIVHLRSGRTFEAEIDAATDEDTLWLRFTTGTTMVLRPIQWEAVVSADYLKRQYDGAAFKAIAVAAGTQRPPQFVVSNEDPSATRPIVTYRPAEALQPQELSRPAKWSTSFPRVQALRIEAVLDHWDADPAIDGVTVYFVAVDKFGQPVSVEGTISASVFGYHRGSFGTVPSAPELGSGIRRISFGETEGNGFLRVPLTQLPADFDQRVHRLGRVEATLTVPGQGTFEASAYVRVKPFDPGVDASFRGH